MEPTAKPSLGEPQFQSNLYQNYAKQFDCNPKNNTKLIKKKSEPRMPLDSHQKDHNLEMINKKNNKSIKVQSKIFDLNRSAIMATNCQQVDNISQISNSFHQNLSSSSGCSTQSSSSSVSSVFCSLNPSIAAPLTITDSRKNYPYSLTSLSSLSSKASSSSNHQHHPHYSRSSLKKAAQNFLNFIECYEQSLLECLSKVGDSNETVIDSIVNKNHDDCIDVDTDTNNNDDDACHQQIFMKRTKKNEKYNDNGDDDNSDSKTDADQQAKTYKACGVNLDEFSALPDITSAYCHYTNPVGQYYFSCCPGYTAETDCATFGEQRKKVIQQKLSKQHNEELEEVSGQIGIESLDHKDFLESKHCKLESATTNTTNEFEQVDKCSISCLSSPNFNNNRVCLSSESKSTIDNSNKNINNDFFRHSLRLQLEKIRELRQQYDYGYRCTEAIEKLEKLLTNKKKSRDCHKEWRANERMLASIENQLESLIGSFLIRVEEIEGWARICPHDTYEIEFRHEKQRQTLRVKIGKTLERIWEMDNRQVTLQFHIPKFHASPKQVIVCRVREVKSGWKNLAVWSKRYVDIGITSISMSEILESIAKKCPILLDANPSGSLKLRITCQWKPNVDVLCSLDSSTPRPLFDKNKDNNKQFQLFDDNPSNANNKDLNEDTNSLLITNKDNLSRSTLNLLTFYGDSNNLINNNHSEINEEKHVNIYTKLNNKCVLEQIESIQNMLTTLYTSLEDYSGQTIEITLMSKLVNSLINCYDKIVNDVNKFSIKYNCIEDAITDDNLQDQASAFIEEAFGFLDCDRYSDINSDNDVNINSKYFLKESEIRNNKNRDELTLKLSSQSFLLELSRWNKILILHLASALNELNHIGSWILKSREQLALSRLQSHTFAMEQIFIIISRMLRTADHILPKDLIIGHDPRVIELWSFIRQQKNSFKLNRLIYSQNYLSSLIVSMIIQYGLIKKPSNQNDDDDLESILHSTGDWFVSMLMIGVGDHFFQSDHSKLITIFNIRAFFELNLHESSYFSNYSEVRKPPMQLKHFFQIALNLNHLLLMKTRKICLFKVKQILFNNFDVDCYWIPPDLTLLLVMLLFEHHSNQEFPNRVIGRSTNELKSGHLKELSKMIHSWMGWLLKMNRFEIREHMLFGLESNCSLTRQASCYGLMCLFKLIKRIEDNSNQRQSMTNCKENYFSQNQNQIFDGKEVDSLLYVSMDDPDLKVRNEARQALKCFGSFGQERLNKLERVRMGFFIGSLSSSNSNSMLNYSKNICSTSFLESNKQKRPDMNGKQFYFGTSMPNLNLVID